VKSDGSTRRCHRIHSTIDSFLEVTDLVFQDFRLGASVVDPIFTIIGYVEVFTRAAHRPHPIALLIIFQRSRRKKNDEGDVRLCACGRIYKHSHELEDEKSIEHFDS